MTCLCVSMERANDLLKDAEDFGGAADDLFTTGRWAKVCFNSHQCAEMALKASLNSLGLDVKGHDLTFLLKSLVDFETGMQVLVDDVKLLDQYYIPTRYANAFHSGSTMEHYTRAQAESAIRIARQILNECIKIVAKRTTQE